MSSAGGVSRKRKHNEIDDPPGKAAPSDEERRRNLGVSTCVFGGARRGTLVTLLDFAASRFTYYSREGWAKRIKAGILKVDGNAADADTPLQNGMKVSMDVPRDEEPSVDLAYRVVKEHRVCEDGTDVFRCVAVQKSGNLPVSPSGRYRKNTLAFELQSTLCLDAKPVHRLDKETSGVVLVGLTDASSSLLSRLFADGSRVSKAYTAVLVGELPLGAPVVVTEKVAPKHTVCGEGYCADAALHAMKKIRMVCHPSGKPCKTTFTPLVAKNGLTLVRVEIEQGRTHQIRVHAEHLKHPLLGDKVYGHGEGSEAQSLAWTKGLEPMTTPHGVIDRHLLHSTCITIDASGPAADGAVFPGGEEELEKWVAYSDPKPFFCKFDACTPLFEGWVPWVASD